jgi:SAM-dependent methyltransferase
LARRGFEVVGVDYVPEMVQRATEHAAREGLRIEGLVQDYSRLEAPTESFDLVVLSAGMYSGIPTRKKRVRMLQAIARSLRPGGYFVCQFQFDPQVNPRSTRVRKAVAFLSLGNFWFEAGDIVWGTEFIHNFSSSEELRAEFAQGGFLVTYLPDLNQADRYGAVLQKPA